MHAHPRQGRRLRGAENLNRRAPERKAPGRLPWAAAIPPELQPFDHEVERLEHGLQGVEGLPRMRGRDLVLHRDVRVEALTILRRQRIGPTLRDAGVQGLQRRRLDHDGDADAQKPQAAGARREWLGLPASLGEFFLDVGELVSRAARGTA